MNTTTKPEPSPLRTDKNAKYTIQNIRRGKKEQGRNHIIYAELHDETGVLVISATLDYIMDRLQTDLL